MLPGKSVVALIQCKGNTCVRQQQLAHSDLTTNIEKKFRTNHFSLPIKAVLSLISIIQIEIQDFRLPGKLSALQLPKCPQMRSI